MWGVRGERQSALDLLRGLRSRWQKTYTLGPIVVFHQNEISQTLSSYNYQEYIDLPQTEK